MKTVFEIGHYSMNIFGMFVGLGIIAGYIFAIKEAKRKEISLESIMEFMLYITAAGIIGARLYYVAVFNLEYYLNNLNKIIAVWDGGLSIQGALIGGAIAALVYARLTKINVWKVADTIAPGIILGQAIGRVGCDVFGIAMKNNYFWGVLRGGQLLHPAQMYESILNYILFGFLWSKRKSVKYDGQLFFTYLIGFSINRFIVEFFRTNPIFLQPFTVAHATSVVLIIISIGAMKILKSNNKIKTSNIDKTFNIKTSEIISIVAAIIISIFLYYNWIWS